MTGTGERYIHDYESAHARQIVQGRTAEVHGAFFLPYLKRGMKVLDLGCGPGTITVGLARITAPGEVVGLELDPGQVELANRNREEAGLKNLKFQVGNVYQLPFSDLTFDAVFSHALFDHLGDLEKALAEAKRVLKPGGVIGLRSADWRGLVYAPRTREWEQVWDLQSRTRQHNGGDPFAGSSFRRLLREAGFMNARAGASYECFGTQEQTRALAPVLASLFTDPAAVAALKAIARPGEPGLERIRQMIEEWGEDPDAMFAHPWCEAVAWK